MGFQVCDKSPGNRRIFLQVPNGGIAVMAEQRADLVGLVIMIDEEPDLAAPMSRLLFADRTTTTL
jgi:hypothetical protein